jgi:hypothetical protein
MPTISHPIFASVTEAAMSTDGLKEIEYLDAFSSLEREERRDQARATYMDLQVAKKDLENAWEEIRRQRIRIQQLEDQQYLQEQQIEPKTFRASEAS